MTPGPIADPGVVDRVDVDPDAPAPSDCLAPSESTVATADLSPGWVALTDRELLVYHPDRDPPVGRVLRPNVTGLGVRRAGARRLLAHVPMASLFAVGGVVVGLLFLTVDPSSFLAVPQDSPVDSLLAVVQALGWALNVLGLVLVFSSVLAGIGAIAVTGYWLASSRVVLVVERGGAEELECPTTLPAGRRAVGDLEEALESHAPISTRD